MSINQAGLNLIKAFEGFRAVAYRCPAGVWTIGYGHTSMAGPPDVKAGDRITKERAGEILRGDVEQFADGVSRLIRVNLNGNQFAALTSFAYNVGLGNFGSSGVLKAVNARQWDAVPRRLALWNKAGGRVLPGLVRRRADEAALFVAAEGASLMSVEHSVPEYLAADMDQARGQIDVPQGKSMLSSTTAMAATLGGLSGLGSLIKDALDQTGQIGATLGLNANTMTWVGLAVTIGISAFWVIKERRAKSTDEGV